MANALRVALQTTCDLAYVDELTFDDFVTFKGVNIGLVFRVDAVLGDSTESVALANFLISAAKTKTIVVSDCMLLEVEHKGVLAVLRDLVSRQSAQLDPEEIDVISRLVPPTWILGSHCPVGQASWEKKLLDRKDDLVLKRMYSFGGSHTFVGRYLSQIKWREAIDKALRAPNLWIAQEYIEPDRLLVVGRRKTLRSGREGVRCVVSPFVFDDVIGGFLCRTQLGEDDGVLGLASGASMGFSMVAEATQYNAMKGNEP